MDTKILENIGFTHGEVRVYLALLDLGETTTGDIIKKSKITGSKVYEILERLIEKGMVSYIVKEKTKYFQASSPKRLMDYLGKKERELADDKRDVKKIISGLEEKQKLKQKTQSSKVFEGYEGVRSVFNLILESLKRREEYFSFSMGEELKSEKLTTFLQNYHQKRIEKGIPVKIIAREEDKKLISVKNLARLKGLRIRYYKNPFPIGVIIFKDYVATFTFKEKPTAFLIQSEQVANSYKNFFSYIWKISKE